MTFTLQNVLIFFVDYGNYETVSFADIYEMPQDCLDFAPFQAFRVQMSDLRANPIMCPDSRWTSKSNEYLKSQLEKCESIMLEVK